MTEVLEAELDDAAGEMAAFDRGLRRYVARVAAALGVGLPSCTIDPNPPAAVYVALDARLARYPARDLALLWDERFGWSAAVETHSGEDLIVVSYLDGALLSLPATVTSFVADLVAGRSSGRPTPPEADPTARADLIRGLSDHAGAH